LGDLHPILYPVTIAYLVLPLASLYGSIRMVAQAPVSLKRAVQSIEASKPTVMQCRPAAALEMRRAAEAFLCAAGTQKAENWVFLTYSHLQHKYNPRVLSASAPSYCEDLDATRAYLNDHALLFFLDTLSPCIRPTWSSLTSSSRASLPFL